jgi:hypothetical protein
MEINSAIRVLSLHYFCFGSDLDQGGPGERILSDLGICSQRAAQRRRGGAQGGKRPRSRDFFGFERARR